MIVSLLLFGLVLPEQAQAKEKWERIMNEEGIRVWRRSVEGSSLLHFRGRAVIRAPLAKVIAVISGADRLCEWRSHCVKAYRLAEATGDRQHVYYRVESPAPFVADRDVVVDATCQRHGAGGVKCPFKSVSHPKDPAPKDAVRMPKLKGYWQLVPKGDGATEATYEVVADPGGWIPKWLANLASKKLPFKALQGLRRQVKVDYSASEARIAAKLARLGL